MAPTTNGDAAIEALRSECESAIEDIRSGGEQALCPAHPALARGVIALLRCKAARLGAVRDEQAADRALRREFYRSVVKAAVILAASAIGVSNVPKLIELLF